ncbi:MAG: methyltransferase domain-containing protein [Candidatus Dormibacteraeota bacterium]|nr:methyltransferase domain-containing protein [Candidatus Dormibacteraeota bacterium]
MSETPAEAAKRLVRSQFSAAATGYVSGAVFTERDDLERMLALAAPSSLEVALDVATGGGHTALAFAPRVRRVVATDLTPEMLAAAHRHLAGAGGAGIRLAVADAEQLPFAAASFDIVTARLAPHHFPRPEVFVAEAARVLRPGGRFVLLDNMAPEEPELDAFLNRLEVWRDPSHVRAHRASEWRAMLERAGLQVLVVDPLVRKRYVFADWTARMRMTEADRSLLEGWLLQASSPCASYFALVVADGRVLSLDATFGAVLARRGAAQP